ncbi:SAV_2336 N-terminal domain-related protein [Mastigocoleus testarum]|uniref:Uncharacterized protein n=1 Tax=Mastigocoleus testarum BC008 TaxID=371196 RepID=A0A0V7ZLN9_9CYAN|nr:SAV_2336 N-terminal domain-related protein [Mastigocoleus testarum]KST65475.1 hypothetical protein BC008_41845 [Mastigocoleus testarum BC008]
MSNEASSKFEKLIATLQQQLKLTSVEIADILWLAQQSKITIKKNSNANPTTEELDKLAEAKDRTKQTSEKTDTSTTPVVTQPTQSQAEVIAKSNPSGSSSSSTSGDTLEIKVPDAPGLRQPLKLARALRPLIQRIDSQTEIILDEEATTKRIADERISIPVFQPVQEPAFDLILVVDESNTMIFWRKTIQQLHKLLKVQGAFRDVQVWRMGTKEEIYLRRGMGTKASTYRHCQPRSLIDPSGKRLFLIASDCVADIWHNGKAFEMLKIWAQKHPVAIIQMLPQWLWQRTGLSLGAKVQFSSLNPRIPNQDLLIKKILLWDDIDFRMGTKIPIFTLEEDSAKTWSKMIGGRGEAYVTGFVFSPNLEDFTSFTLPDEDSSRPEIEEPETTEEITSNFRRTASRIARKLASLLSAAPIINLPIVRIIQAQMFPQSQQVHVAEVFLGGIIKRKQESKTEKNEITSETNPDEIEFEFISEDVRNNFLDAAPISDSLEIIEVISKYFAKKLDKTLLEFNALLRKPQQVDEENREEIKPFALLSAKVLKRLGGDYVRFAEEMEQGWDDQIFEVASTDSTSMSKKVRNIYAVLVGIDNYPNPTFRLKSCVNDVAALEEYLRSQIKAEVQLHLKTLKDREATRQAIIDSFRQHLCQAESNDVALFYYAGHGSQELAPPEFWDFEPDKLNNTLVCYDSHLEGGWDLADKELDKLISEIAQKNPHIILILDCSHSGSRTRNPSQQTAVRESFSNDERTRPLDSFIFSPEEILNLTTSGKQNFDLPTGRHILFASCQKSETAKEYRTDDGISRGAFSYFLTETLKQTQGNLTYRDLFQRTNALVRSKIRNQSPQLEATIAEDLDQLFLSGAIGSRYSYCTVSYHKVYGWVIDGGAIHGIPHPNGEETMHLALFPIEAQRQDLRKLSNKIGEAKVTEVLPQLSKIEISSDMNFDLQQTFKAVITSLPLPPKAVSFVGDLEGVQLLREALPIITYNFKPSLYVREIRGNNRAELKVLAHNEEYIITRTGNSLPIVKPIQGYTKNNAIKIIKRLEHISRWIIISQLSNIQTNEIKAGDVKMEVINKDGEVLSPSRDMHFSYKYQDEKLQPPEFKLKLTNTTNKTLYCTLVCISDSYSISAPFFESGCIKLEAQQEAYALDGEELLLEIPDDYWEQGITEYQDIVKLIVCEGEFDGRLLTQGKLDAPHNVSRNTISRGQSSLEHLMNRMQNREIRPKGNAFRFDDWYIEDIRFTTVRPLPTPEKEENTLVLLSDISFETVTVNSCGEIINRETKTAQYFTENIPDNITLDMVYIPGGKFMMGTADEEVERLIEKFPDYEEYFRWEQPQHEVTVPAFFMGKYPVTQAQWKAVANLPQVEKELKLDPSEFKGDMLPVEQVDWFDAVEFCKRLSNHTGKQYRLPSEAEWEYACRAGTTTPFHFGETITHELANYDVQNTFAEEPQGEYTEKTTPVGTFPPNPFCLYDMHGNVWEWCYDEWHNSYENAPFDGSSLHNANNINTKNNDRVLRGSSWLNNPLICRSTLRVRNNPVNRDGSYGFRVVCVVSFRALP